MFKKQFSIFWIKFGLQSLIEYFLPDTKNLYTNLDSYNLGLKSIKLKKGSCINKIYRKDNIKERHWNNWTIDVSKINVKELVVSGSCNDFVDVIEVNNKVFGVLFHPEFISKPNNAHPLFIHFLKSINK